MINLLINILLIALMICNVSLIVIEEINRKLEKEIKI